MTEDEFKHYFRGGPDILWIVASRWVKHEKNISFEDGRRFQKKQDMKPSTGTLVVIGIVVFLAIFVAPISISLYLANEDEKNIQTCAHGKLVPCEMYIHSFEYENPETKYARLLYKQKTGQDLPPIPHTR